MHDLYDNKIETFFLKGPLQKTEVFVKKRRKKREDGEEQEANINLAAFIYYDTGYF